MPVLTAIDVCSIQSYIFASNKLKDIVENSKAIEWATSIDGVLTLLKVDENKVLMAGGGNVLLQFENNKSAIEFSAKYSRKIYDNYPYMKLAIVHREYKEGQLATLINCIMKDLAVYKLKNISNRRLLGLGVTIGCSNTGLPASHFDKKRKESIANSCNISNHFKSKLNIDYYGLDDTKYTFTDELDSLGRTLHDTSYLGIVHVDGNSIGNKIKDWINNKISNNDTDEKVKQEYKSWSKSLSELAERSFKRVCEKVINNIIYFGNKPQMGGQVKNLFFNLKEENKKIILPVRPIIIGGDDITFVCDGRIALSLAQIVMEEFHNTKIPEFDDNPLGACAGVAFIKTHYPFAKGYELAEKLCANAKKHESVKDDKSNCSLDWHIGNIKPFADLDEIRIKQYHNNINSNLTLKPYILDYSEKPEACSWQWLSKTVLGKEDGLGFRGNYWATRKNKVKNLVSELKNDSNEQFYRYVQSLRVIDPYMKFPDGINEIGQSGSGYSLIDAIEILDIHQIL